MPVGRLRRTALGGAVIRSLSGDTVAIEYTPRCGLCSGACFARCENADSDTNRRAPQVGGLSEMMPAESGFGRCKAAPSER